MNSCKIMYVQDKFMKGTWASDPGGGGRVKFTGAKKRSSNCKELNKLIASSVGKSMKIKNKFISKYPSE